MMEKLMEKLSLAPGVETYSLGDFPLECGATLPSAWIAYKTFGKPSSPAILYPTWYSGSIGDNEWLIGDGDDDWQTALSPRKYFIIVPALIGNGESISPSNAPLIAPFPPVSYADNVRAQHALVTKQFGLTHLRAVVGWSMGAGQAYQWATQFPDFMDIIAPFCGSARTSLHNQVFLEGIKSALLAAKKTSSAGNAQGRVEIEGTMSSRSWSHEERTVGLKAFGRVYAGWGFSQAFYRAKLYEKAYGAATLEEFMQTFWEKWALSKDPENLLVMLQTWQSGDCSALDQYNGNLATALWSIKAKALVMPCKTDLYFPPEDSEFEVESMQKGKGTLEVIPSIWGHWAGGPPGNMDDAKWIDEKIGKFLAEN